MAFDCEPWEGEPIFETCPGCGKVILPNENVTIIHHLLDSCSVRWHSTCSEFLWMPKIPPLRFG